MTITLNDIISLRTKIETDRKKLEEREKALRVVEAMIQEESASAQHQETLAFEAPTDTRINVFSVAVRDATTHFEGLEFTVVNIEDLLTSQGIKIPQKYARERISTILKKMVEHGLVSVSKGTGSQPHRYRYLGKGTAQKVRPANGEHIAGLVSHASTGAPS